MLCLFSLWVALLLTVPPLAAQPLNTAKDPAACSLTVQTLPLLAEVRLDGKFQGRAPVTVKGLRPGQHEISVKLSGYAGYRTVVTLDSGRAVTMEITLSNALYEQWREQYYNAIVSNILIPGKGQVDNGHSRGWGYFLGYAAASGYAYYCSNRYQHHRQKYESHQALYDAETNPDETWIHYQNLTGALDKMHDYQNQFETALTAVGVVLGVSLIDALFFTVPRPVINDANPVRISAQPFQGGGMVGVEVKF